MKHNAKRLISIVLALGLMFSLMSTAFAAGEMPDGNFTDLQALIDGVGSSGTVTLDRDYVAAATEEALHIRKGTTVTIDLNGHRIDRDLDEAAENGSVIIVDAAEYTEPDLITTPGGALTITDMAPVAMGALCNGNTTGNGGGVLVDEYASLTIEYALILGCFAEGNGGGICLENGASCVMNDGTISVCGAGDYGGGISAGNMTVFEMNSGEISFNDAANGGGISLLSGDFTISEAYIMGNVATECGGGICNLGSFALVDGWIYENTAAEKGAGVYNAPFAEMLVSGAPAVVDNALDSGDVSNVYTITDTRTDPAFDCSASITIADEGLSEDAYIGVFCELYDGSEYTAPTAERAAEFCTNGTAGDAAYFVSDSSSARVVYNSTRRALDLQYYGGPLFDLCNREPVLYVDELTADTVQWGDYKFTGFYTAPTGGEKVTSGHQDGVIYYAHWENNGRPVLTENLTIDETDAFLLGEKPADEALLAEYGITYDAAAHEMTLDDAAIHVTSDEKSIFADGSPLTLKVAGTSTVKNDYSTVITAVNGLTIEPVDSSRNARLELICDDSESALWVPDDLTVQGTGLEIFAMGCVSVIGDFCLKDATLSVFGDEPIWCSSAFSMESGTLTAVTFDGSNPALRAETFNVDLSKAAVGGSYGDNNLHFDAEKKALVYADGSTASFVDIFFTSFDPQNGTPVVYERPENPSWNSYTFSGWYNLPVGGEKVHDGTDFAAPYTSFVPGGRYYANWTKDGSRIFSGRIQLADSELSLDCTEFGEAVMTGDNAYSIMLLDDLTLDISASSVDIVSDLLTEAEAVAAADGAAPEDVMYRRFEGIPAAEYRMGDDKVYLAPDGNGKLARIVFKDAFDGADESAEGFFAMLLMNTLRADSFADDENIFIIVREMTILQVQKLSEGYTGDAEVARILDTLQNWTTEYAWWDNTLEQDEAPFEILISELYHRIETLSGHQLVAHASFWLTGREADYTGGRPFAFCTAQLTDLNGKTITRLENEYGVFTFDGLAPGYYNLCITALADSLGEDDDFYGVVSKLVYLNGTDPQSVEANMTDSTPSSRLVLDRGILAGNLDTLQPTAYGEINQLPGPSLTGYVDGGFELTVKKTDESVSGADEIRAIADADLLTFYDASLRWTANDADGEELESVALHDVSVPAVGRDNALAIVIPADTANGVISAYRWHDGQAEQLRQIFTLPGDNASDGTYYVGSGYVILFASRFSTYALGYTELPVLPIAPAAPKYDTCPKNASCPMSRFTDLTPGAWYHDGIHFCLDNGLMNGMTANSFAPDGTATRGQIVTILYRIAGEPPFMNDNRFSDVARGSYYERAIVWANGKGIVNGYGDGRFGPNDPITREQLAAILYRCAKYKEMDVSVDENTNFLSFNDFWDVSEYAKPAMMWAIANGLIQGTDGDLLPQGGATRAQAAAVFCRWMTK